MTSRDKFLFSAGADVTIKVWDISDIKNSKGCIHTLFGHRDDVRMQHFTSPHGKYNQLTCVEPLHVLFVLLLFMVYSYLSRLST